MYTLNVLKIESDNLKDSRRKVKVLEKQKAKQQDEFGQRYINGSMSFLTFKGKLIAATKTDEYKAFKQLNWFLIRLTQEEAISLANFKYNRDVNKDSGCLIPRYHPLASFVAADSIICKNKEYLIERMVGENKYFITFTPAGRLDIELRDEFLNCFRVSVGSKDETLKVVYSQAYGLIGSYYKLVSREILDDFMNNLDSILKIFTDRLGDEVDATYPAIVEWKKVTGYDPESREKKSDSKAELFGAMM